MDLRKLSNPAENENFDCVNQNFDSIAKENNEMNVKIINLDEEAMNNNSAKKALKHQADIYGNDNKKLAAENLIVHVTKQKK